MMPHIRKVQKFLTKILKSYNFLGILIALIFLYFAIKPSLLPHSWLWQGIVNALSMLLGYGLGILLSWIARKTFIKKEISSETKVVAWRILTVVTVIFILLLSFLYYTWQNDLRDILNIDERESYSNVILIWLFTGFFFLFIIKIVALLRYINRKLRVRISKHVHIHIAGVLSVILIVFIIYTSFSGIFKNMIISRADKAHSSRNKTTPENISKPGSDFKSGSDASLVEWDTLGYQGKSFVASGPSAQDISKFNGKEALEPVRVYVGVNTVSTIEERLELAIKEMERTNAFEREVVSVIIPTGTGWVSPYIANSFEYLMNGDSAIVAVQYSYLSSWISVLVDGDLVVQTGTLLLEKVKEKIQSIPEYQRPKLFVAGISLGSYGAQSLFKDVNDVLDKTDKALFFGTPNRTELWREIKNNRDEGSLERLPVYNGAKNVKFMDEIDDITSSDFPTRILYVHNASDQTIWWDTKIIYKKPDWLKEERGEDVSKHMRWFPGVTYIQMLGDMFGGYDESDGHGHKYRRVTVDAWAEIIEPEGWTKEKAEELKDVLDSEIDF